MISSAAIASTITQVLSSSMLANEANNLNLLPEQHSQRRTLRVSLSSLSGDRGKTAAAAEGPWSDPLANAPSRGSHKTLLQSSLYGRTDTTFSSANSMCLAALSHASCVGKTKSTIGSPPSLKTVNP